MTFILVLLFVNFLKYIYLFLGIGAIEIFFGNFKFDQIYSGWYPIFPLFSLGLDPNYSP